MPDFSSKDTQNEQDFDLKQFKLDDQTFMAQFQANMAAFYKRFPD
jgi:penicillin-binding protein-related factor A (putative recombinase)